MVFITNSRLSKKILVVLSVVLAMFMSLSSINASASDISKLTQTDEYQEKLKIVERSLVFEDNIYKIDENLAKNDLSQEEINNINTYFKNIDPELLNIALKSDPNEGISTYALPLLPVAVVAFLGTLAATVGWELAALITADFYKWGVTSACNKWKDVKVVKSFCSSAGYL